MATTYTVTGVVVAATALGEVNNLRVEAWDSAGIFPDLVGLGVTDTEGLFQFRLTDEDLAAIFGERVPEVFFRVIQNDRDILADTAGSQVLRIGRPTASVRILVNGPVGTVESVADFKVRGRVYDVNSGPLAAVPVTVFDVGIASADDAELTDPLAPIATDARGYYEVTYTAADLIEGKILADLEVRVDVAGVEHKSEVRCQAPPTLVMDVVVGAAEYRGPTEHQTLFGAVQQRLGSAVLAALDDAQIEKVACGIGRPQAHVRGLVRAHAIRAEHLAVATNSVSLDTEVLYGLIREGLPDDRKALLSVPRHQLRNAITRAKDRRTIAELDAGQMAAALDTFRDAVVELAKEDATGLTTCNIDQVIATVQTNAAKRDAFHAYYAANEDTAGNMWTNAVGVGGLTSQEVADIQFALQIGVLSRYYLPLIQFRVAQADPLEDVAAFDEADWLGELNTLASPGYPDGIPGANDTERRSNYAALLTRTMESAMPTRAIAGRVKKNQPGSDLDKFFSQNTSFDFRVHRVSAFLPTANLGTVSDPNALAEELGKMERLFKVVPRHDEMKPLLDDGFGSARSIARFGRQRFIDTYASAVGGQSNAKRIYDQSVLQASAAALLHLWFNPWANGPELSYVPSYDGRNPPSNDLVADWETLFGSLDSCACEHCASVFSPAAYLTDLLSWLGRFDSNVSDTVEPSYLWTAKEVLIGGDHTGLIPVGGTIEGRRPDIPRLLLNCNNTFTVMPYIDLVIELLEWRAAGVSPPLQIDTTAKSEQLLAAPEILDPTAHANAYDALTTAYYPWILPYSLYHHQARVYLEHLGVRRHELMEELQRAVRPTQIAGCRLWLRADLGTVVEGGDRVAQWLDLSGNGNDAVQESDLARPRSGIDDAGELAYIGFAGAERLRVEPAGSLDITAAATIVVVASHVGAATTHYFLFKGAVAVAQNYGVSRSSSDAALAHYTNVIQTGPSWAAEGSTASVCVTTFEANDTTWRIDGTETSQTGQTNTLVATVEPLHIGARATAAWPTDSAFDTHLTGRIYEIILYDKVLSPTELADLEGYLLSRYGTAAAALSPTELEIAQERLGMIKTEREIIEGQPPYGPTDTPWLRWGFSVQGTWDQDLKRASTFLEASDLRYEELRELLDALFMTAFTTTGAQPTLAPEIGYDGCDPERLFIADLDETSGLAATWNAVQRFLRLRRRLGWSIRELDKVVTALSGQSFDGTFMKSVGALLWLRDRFERTGLLEMAGWWAALDSQPTPSLEEPSFYASVFLNEAVKNPPPAAFDPPTGTEDLIDHLPHILASIRMREGDFALLFVEDEARTRLRLGLALTDDKLNLDSLSRLYRIASFARSTGVKIADLRVLTALTGLAPLLGDTSPSSGAPGETRRFVEEIDRLREAKLTIPEVHYLVRHVPRSSEGVAAEDLAVEKRLDALDLGLEGIVGATTYVEDTTGKNLRTLLSKIIASENPGLPAEHVSSDVDIVMGIVDGSRLLTDDLVLTDDAARKSALERILGPYVDDVESIKNGLVHRPWLDISGCQLWLDPQGIAHTESAFTGWSLTVGSATVRLPLLDELSGLVLWLRGDVGVEEAAGDPAEDTDPVLNWLDQSALGHDATQSTLANRPIYTATGGVNGQPGVNFVRSSSHWMDLGTLTNSSNEYSLFVALDQRSETTPLQAGISTFGGSTDLGFYPVSNGSGGTVGLLDAGPWRDVAPSIAGEQYLTWTVDTSPLLTMYRDAVALGTGTYSGSRSFGVTTHLGKYRGSATHFLDAVVSEIAVYDRDLPSNELAFVHSHLSRRYALPGPVGPRYVPEGPFGLPAVQLNGRKDYLVLDGLSYSETSHTFACIVRQASTDVTSGMALLDVNDGALVLAGNTQTTGDPSVGYFDGSWVDHADAVTGDQILTWALSDTGNAAQLYRDGEPLAELPSAFSGSIAMSGLVALGGRVGPGKGSFDGMIACVALYNRALDDAELAQLHGYLLTLAGKPPASRFELVEKPLLDFWRRREARTFIKQSLASSTGIATAVAAALLAEHLQSVVDPDSPLIDDLLPETHAAPRPTTTVERFDAVMRFSKAATVVQRFHLTADELAWLRGTYRDPGWLDLNELPLRLHGVEVFDAQHAARVEGELELPRWLTVTCPTAERSAQTSASTVRTGLGTDAARAVSRDGASWALLIEPARDNLVTQQDWRSWTLGGTPIITTAVTAAGDVAHVEIFDDDTGVAEGVSIALSSLDTLKLYTVSGWTWVLTAPQGGSYTLVWLNAGSALIQFAVRVAETAWRYHDGTAQPLATSGVLQQTPRAGSDTGITRFWGTQVELGGYPTSFIGSDNATFSRAADTLAVDGTALTSLEAGYFRFTVRFAPLYAHDETAADHDLLFFDGTHRVYFRQSDKRIVADWGGQSVTSDPLTFVRHRELTVSLVHLAAELELTVSGAGSGNGTFGVPSSPSAVSWQTTFHLLGNASGAQEGAALRYLRFEHPDPEADMVDARRRYAGLKRLADTAALRDRLRRRGTDLFDLFAATADAESMAEGDWLAIFSAQTQYPRVDVAALAARHALSYPADYRNERALSKMVRGLELARRLGVSALRAADWTDVDGLSGTSAQSIAEATLDAAKDKHAARDWPEIGRPLRDRLRTAQRDALVAHILHTDPDPDLATPADLYDELLVDPEMSPCALTSRIANAISSVQLYIHRILLGLEETQLDKDAREQWKWRKNYRVWEANRKVLLWPENWIYPELRDDKTPFFEKFESKLRQGDITDALAEDAYRDYLERLDEVAQLHVVGMVHHQQPSTEEHSALDELHVFARTYGRPPYTIFHRRWVDRQYWTPWVEVPIEATSTIYLPIVEHGRLSLHWLTVSSAEPATSGLPPEALQPRPRIQLHSSHFDQRSWSKPHASEMLELLPVENAEELVHERNETDPTYSAVIVNGNRILARAKLDPCRGFFETLEPVPLKVDEELLEVGLMPSTSQSTGKVTILVQSMPMTVLEDPSQGALSEMIIEKSGYKFTTPTGSVTRILDRDVIIMHMGQRRLFGAFDPFPTESGPELFLHSRSWHSTQSTIEAKQIPFIDAVYVESAPALQSFTVPNSIYQTLIPLKPSIRFHSFWHPYVCSARELLYRHGVAGLRDYFRRSPDPLQETFDDYFVTTMLPTEAVDGARVEQPYPRDEIELHYGGAYSTYNWELFFHIPMLLATWLKDARRYEEARDWLHAIFDPGDGDITQSSDVWRFRRFRELQSVSALQNDIASGSPVSDLAKWLEKVLGGNVSAESDAVFEQQIAAWEADPFNPNRIARMRPVAYMKKTVRLYVELLVDWGDHLFRQDTVEAIVEAQQLYMLALKILGDRPITVEPPGDVAPKSYLDLEPELDLLGNALVELEGLVPVVPKGSTKPVPSLPDIEVAYFCVPRNEKLLELWDIVEDRLFKIRHCMNIEGVVRQLPLFQPPIDPGLLVKAKAAGLDIASVLGQLYAPPPLHRYQSLYQRAVDFAQYVTSLGQALLSALEKKDSEALGNLRASHEVGLLELVKETRIEQVRQAEQTLEATRLSLEQARVRRDHYRGLIEDGLSARETSALEKTAEGNIWQYVGQGIEALAQMLHMIPTFEVGGSGMGPHTVATLGGSNFASALSAQAQSIVLRGSILHAEATQETTTASYARRSQDWSLQLRHAEADFAHISREIVVREVGLEIAKKELASHERQLEQSKEVRDFLEDKYTNEELYLWMIGELQETYYQAYKLAFDMARRAERAWQFERLEPDTFFIQFGYWDGFRKGLLAGEKLLLDLRRMDAAYLEKDRRDYEITKSISLSEHGLLALIKLRETGSIVIDLPESLFDLDYPGHYFRRIKSVSLTIPAVVGPHTSVNCTLTLLSHKIRVKSTVSGGYGEPDDGSEDPRFTYAYGQVQSVCTSRGVNDSGMFELDFRGERLLPFEGAGAISRWRIDLPKETNRFDLRSLSDVIVHIQYTAREGGGVLGEAAKKAALASVLPTAARLISVKDELAAAWKKFQTLDATTNDQVLELDIEKKLPYVPGTGSTRLVYLHAALHIEHPDAATIELPVSLDPEGDPTTNPVKLFDASLAVTLVSYVDTPAELSAPLKITVDQDAIKKLPAELTEETPAGSGLYRLAPSVFRNLWLVAEIERDPPVV